MKQVQGEKRYYAGARKVTKALLTYRNPLQIVLSRFKEYHEKTVGDGISFNTKGLHDWCSMIDIKRKRTKEIKKRLNSQAVMLSGLDVKAQVPCYSEFIRILKWYDNALELRDEHLKFTRLIKYEKLRRPLKKWADSLFDDLDDIYQKKGAPVLFTGEMKDYDLFTQEDKENIKLFIKIIGEEASKSYEQLFKSYLDEI